MLRIDIVGELATGGRTRGGGVESTSPISVRDTRNKIAANVGGQRNIANRAGPNQIRRSAQTVELGRAEDLDDLGASVIHPAAVEKGAGGPMTNLIRGVTP